MAVPIAELFVSVGADVSTAVAGLDMLAGKLGSLSELGIVAGGLVIAGAFAEAIDLAAEFDQKLTEVRNNTTLTDQGFEDMKTTLFTMLDESPAKFDKLAEGFMHASNFGFDAANSTKILDAAMKSAVSTGGDTAKTTEVLAAVLHEFGLTGDDAATVMDHLHTAAAEGNMTLEQFSDNFGQVAAWAAALGVPMDEVAAAMSTMTRHGFDAAAAGTQVKDMLEHLIKPSAEAQKELARLSEISGVNLTGNLSPQNLELLRSQLEKMSATDLGKLSEKINLDIAGVLKGTTEEDLGTVAAALPDTVLKKMGITFDESALSATNLSQRGMAGVLQQLQGAMDAAGMTTEQQTAEWMKLIPNIRGGAAAFILAGRGAQDFIDIQKAMADSAGVTEAAFAREADTLNFKLGVLTNSLQKLGIQIGEELEPYVEHFVDFLIEWIPQLPKLPGTPTELGAQLGKQVRENFGPEMAKALTPPTAAEIASGSGTLAAPGVSADFGNQLVDAVRTQNLGGGTLAVEHPGTSPLLTIGQLIVNNEGDVQSLLGKIAGVIKDSATRVEMPPENAGNPAFASPVAGT